MNRRPRRQNSSTAHTLITSQEDFQQLCDEIERDGIVAFDTEFVSETSYRPRLCLLQLATEKHAVAVDPFQVGPLDRWWDIMTNPDVTLIVHGGREEIRFCLFGCDRPPQSLIDVQIAEGLISRGYPLGYSALVQRVLDRKVHGKHTRSDWSRRPLSTDQISYAIEDVQYLIPIWRRQQENLRKLGRDNWVTAECERYVTQLANEPRRGDWTRIPGAMRLSPREAAVLRELHACRELEAERRDRPPRTVIRDDLLLGIARLMPTSVDEILQIRGMERRDYRRLAEQLLQAVETGRALPEEELPNRGERQRSLPDTEALTKLLGIALANRCAELSISTGLVGTASDLHELVHWHVFRRQRGERPRLMQGWREEVCGDLLADVMDGKVSLRVTSPTSDHPLVFERTDGQRVGKA